jgi:hypothetical protein
MGNYTRRVKEILSRHGCVFDRQGKGDHEIWRRPINGDKFPVDDKIVSRDMGNVVLKQAGITDERLD